MENKSRHKVHYHCVWLLFFTEFPIAYLSTISFLHVCLVCSPAPRPFAWPAAEWRWLMKWCLSLWWWRSTLPGVCCHPFGQPHNQGFQGQTLTTSSLYELCSAVHMHVHISHVHCASWIFMTVALWLKRHHLHIVPVCPGVYLWFPPTVLKKNTHFDPL